MIKKATKRITQAEIAKMTGLSRSTVGHILNGKAKNLNISPETEKKINEIAMKHGYLANNAARRLRSSQNGDRTYQVAFIITSSDHNTALPFGGLAIINRLLELGYHTLIINVDKISQTISPLFQERHFDGMIIYGVVPNWKFFTEWGLNHNIPYVFLNHESQSKNNSGIDEQHTAEILVDQLSKQGYNRLAFYFQRQSLRDYLFLRERCIRDATCAVGLEFCPDTIEQHKESENTAKFIMDLKNPPDCVITYNFYHGMRFYQELHKLGLSAPKDVGVVTYDMSRYCVTTIPPLCAIAFDEEKLGQNAAEMIVKRIETGKVLKNKLIKGKLMREYMGIALESLDHHTAKEKHYA